MVPFTGFYLFEGRTYFSLHFIEKCGTEGIAGKSIIKVSDIPPNPMIAVAAFRNETVYVGIPFQVSAKCMKNHDKAGSEVQGFIPFEKHAGDNTVYGVKKAVEEGTVIQEKVPKLFINGKDAMAVFDINELKGHRGSALHGVKISAGGAKTAMASEGNKF